MTCCCVYVSCCAVPTGLPLGLGIKHSGAEASLGARPIAHPMEMTEEVYPVLCVVSACDYGF